MSTRQAKPSPDRPLVLWRTPGQTFRWAARSPLVAALSWVLAIALLAAGTWWQWPTIMQTYDRVTEAFQPDEPPYKPLALNVELEAAVVEQVNAFRSDLTRAVGAAGAMITAKSAAGVPADKIKPTQDALAAAQAMLDSNVRIAPPLQASLDALTAATTQLSGETPPPPPAPQPPPDPAAGRRHAAATASTRARTAAPAACDAWWRWRQLRRGRKRRRRQYRRWRRRHSVHLGIRHLQRRDRPRDLHRLRHWEPQHRRVRPRKRRRKRHRQRVSDRHRPWRNVHRHGHRIGLPDDSWCVRIAPRTPPAARRTRVRMTTRDDQGNLHDRSGKFARKENSAPSGSLGDDVVSGPARTPLSIEVLDHPHPEGGFDLAVEAPTGRHYLLDGRPHREDGPAYEGRDGTQEWRVDGMLHRDGAPAVIHDDGTEEFWEHGRLVLFP